MTSKKRLREDGLTTIVFKQVVHIDLSEFDERTANDMIDTLAYKIKRSLNDNLASSKWVTIEPELIN